MNGFANAILTLLLSWMRVLVNDLWRLLSSEDAGLFYRFLAANWKVIVADSLRRRLCDRPYRLL